MALAFVCACIDLYIKVVAIRQRVFCLCYIQKLEFRGWRQAIGFIDSSNYLGLQLRAKVSWQMSYPACG